MFKQTNTPLVQFVSVVPGLSSIEECRPKPSNKFLPDWWVKTPIKKATSTLNTRDAGNVKNCPSFPDYFSKGFIIPMWTDTVIKYNSKTDVYNWITPSETFQWHNHSNEQFLKDVPFTFLNKKVQFVFKALCPWRIITPKGYSVYQLPLTYHFNNEFAVFPGIIDTDVHHTVHQQLMVFDDDVEIFIKRGTPFVQYVPFKRETQNLDVRDSTEEDTALFNGKDLSFSTKFPGSKQYNTLRKSLLKGDRDE
jgi:hypothetical protein